MVGGPTARDRWSPSHQDQPWAPSSPSLMPISRFRGVLPGVGGALLIAQFATKVTTRTSRSIGKPTLASPIRLFAEDSHEGALVLLRRNVRPHACFQVIRDLR